MPGISERWTKSADNYSRERRTHGGDYHVCPSDCAAREKQSGSSCNFYPGRLQRKSARWKKNSLFLRARCFKDYIHVRPSAFPTVDGRIRALIKLMQPPRASYLSSPLQLLAALYTSRIRVHVSVNTVTMVTFMNVAVHVGNGATACQLPLGATGWFLRGTFLADWYRRKTLNLGTGFPIRFVETFSLGDYRSRGDFGRVIDFLNAEILIR